MIKERGPVFLSQNWIAIDPDQIFDRDHDRDFQTKIADRFEKKFRDPILI